MAQGFAADGSIDGVAERLATILNGGTGSRRDAARSDLIFSPDLRVTAFEAAPGPPPQVWAVDGGQALVADARCLQVYATRSARVCWAGNRTVLEEPFPLRAWLLGLGEEQGIRRALTGEGAEIEVDCSIDVNLLREWGEWSAARHCVEQAAPGSLVLVDGDLQADWRLRPGWLAGLLEVGAEREVTVVGVTKHTSLSWGGAPLLAVVERQAGEEVGTRRRWWVPVAQRQPSVGPGVAVVVARLDPDARFAFRVDVPTYADLEHTLSRLATVTDDAAFPGYPYPLSNADRLAACPAWVRDEVWSRIQELFERRGVDPADRDRAFADRHRLMERY